MRQLTFVTGNARKAAELSRYLHHPVLHRQLDLPEIQSTDPIAVATAKAEEAYRHIAQPVLVEDFSLSFAALGQLPGPLIKWFLQELKPAGLCQLLDGYQNRQATATSVFGFADHDGVKVFVGAIVGTVSQVPQGDHGYGAESIFVPDGQKLTWGQMDADVGNRFSSRRIGLDKLASFLTER